MFDDVTTELLPVDGPVQQMTRQTVELIFTGYNWSSSPALLSLVKTAAWKAVVHSKPVKTKHSNYLPVYLNLF